jgi:hypothetical protein
MEKLDKIYYVISQKDPKIYEDILLIDGAIEQINIEYKKEILKKFKAKYFVKLNRIKYNLYDKKIEKKIEKDVTSHKKALNTKLGTLKLFLIRATVITLIDKYELEAILEKIASEDNIEKLDEYFARIDEISYDYSY